MGGVNNAAHYIKTMGIGYTAPVNGEPTPFITNSLLQGGIVSVYYLGTLVGALIGGWVGDKVGRIRAIAFGAAWAILGASLQCSAQNHTWMILARLINGWGTGVLNAIVPVWSTETAEHTNRGQFIAIEFTLNIFGVVVAYWMELWVPLCKCGAQLTVVDCRTSTTAPPRFDGVSQSRSRSSHYWYCSARFGSSQSPHDGWSKSDAKMRHAGFWASSETAQDLRAFEPKPNTKRSSRLLRSRKTRHTRPRT